MELHWQFVFMCYWVTSFPSIFIGMSVCASEASAGRVVGFEPGKLSGSKTDTDLRMSAKGGLLYHY